jgi:hypothetical protein
MPAWYNVFAMCAKDGNLWKRRTLSTYEEKEQINVLCNLNRKMFREISWVSGVYYVIITLEISDNFLRKSVASHFIFSRHIVTLLNSQHIWRNFSRVCYYEAGAGVATA